MDFEPSEKSQKLSSTKNRVRYMAHDWPDNFHMSDEAFVNYAEKLETQVFEDDIRSLSASLYQLTAAREDTIRKLRTSAGYLDSIWFRLVMGSGSKSRVRVGFGFGYCFSG